MVNCHCSDCQRASGAPFASGFLVRKSDLAVEGEVREYVYEVPGDQLRVVRRSFCPCCGTPMFAQSSASEQFVSVRAATLDDQTWFRPQMDCFVRSAQSWVVMDPSIAKHETVPH
jgi:hypothetical protein